MRLNRTSFSGMSRNLKTALILATLAFAFFLGLVIRQWPW